LIAIVRDGVVVVVLTGVDGVESTEALDDDVAGVEVCVITFGYAATMICEKVLFAFAGSRVNGSITLGSTTL
jgi:hypothetical protein